MDGNVNTSSGLRLANSSHSTQSLHDLNLSHEEIDQLTQAFDDSQFRSLLDNYVADISNPSHQEEKEAYLKQLQDAGELDKGTELLKPKPGILVRLRMMYNNGSEQNLYINICSHERCHEIKMSTETAGESLIELPFCLGAPRMDVEFGPDRATCLTCEACFNPLTLEYLRTSRRFLRIAVMSIQSKFQNVHLRKNEVIRRDYQVMRCSSCKGNSPHIISVSQDHLKSTKGTKQSHSTKDAGNREQLQSTSCKNRTRILKKPHHIESKKKNFESKKHKLPEISHTHRVSDGLRRSAKCVPPVQSCCESGGRQDNAQGRKKVKIPKPPAVHDGQHDSSKRENDQNTVSEVPQFKTIFSKNLDLCRASVLDNCGKVSPSEERVRLEVLLPDVFRKSDVELDLEGEVLTVKTHGKHTMKIKVPYKSDAVLGRVRFTPRTHILSLIVSCNTPCPPFTRLPIPDAFEALDCPVSPPAGQWLPDDSKESSNKDTLPAMKLVMDEDEQHDSEQVFTGQNDVSEGNSAPSTPIQSVFQLHREGEDSTTTCSYRNSVCTETQIDPKVSNRYRPATEAVPSQPPSGRDTSENRTSTLQAISRRPLVRQNPRQPQSITEFESHVSRGANELAAGDHTIVSEQAGVEQPVSSIAKKVSNGEASTLKFTTDARVARLTSSVSFSSRIWAKMF